MLNLPQPSVTFFYGNEAEWNASIKKAKGKRTGLFFSPLPFLKLIRQKYEA